MTYEFFEIKLPDGSKIRHLQVFLEDGGAVSMPVDLENASYLHYCELLGLEVNG